MPIQLPSRFDLHATYVSCQPVTKTVPGPVFMLCNEASLHGIAMDIAELFYELAFG